MSLLEPKEFPLDGKIYILSMFPAIQGREIIAKYPLSSLPKLGDYAINEETMYKLMNYVAIQSESGVHIRLSNKDLINNHIKSWESLIRIEAAMIEYNCSFFRNGRVSTFLEDFAQKLPTWISKILTDCLGRSSLKNSPHSTNSEQSTH